MSASIDARERLYAALAPLMPAGRVEKYTTTRQMARPYMSIGLASRTRGFTRTNGSPVVRIAYPITIVGDGGAAATEETLDRLADAVWQAADRAKFVPLSSTPGEIEIPSASTDERRRTIRTVTVVVEIDVLPSALCPTPAPPEPAWPVSQPEELTHV